MPLDLLYGETATKIEFDLAEVMTAMGKDIVDRTDLIFMLKTLKTDADVDAVYSVTEGAELVVSGTTVTAYVTDYSGIVAGTRYFIGLGIKFAGDTTYREISFTSATDSIIYKQDVIRG